jgi:hypothetical protein
MIGFRLRCMWRFKDLKKRGKICKERRLRLFRFEFFIINLGIIDII